MLNRFVERFIYQEDKLDPEKHMQGRYFVLSFVVFFFLSLLAVLYLLLVPGLFEKNPEAVYANGSFVLVSGGIIACYSKWGARIFWVNFISLSSIGAMTGTYDATGGIWSSDHIWGIVMAAWTFLVAGRISGIVWTAVTIASVLFFYYAEIHQWKPFAENAVSMGAEFPAFNFVVSAAFVLIIIWLYDNSKRKFVNELRASKAEVDLQKKELESQKEDIISSINYAKKIQQAVLPHEEFITRGIPLSFFLYKPRDIVSGDFYWYHEIDKDNYILVCADCTGHGVPGAFMTVIGSNILTQVVKELNITSPSEILTQLDNRVNETLKQEHSRYSEVQDGMDLSIIRVNKSKKEIIFTSAKRVAFFVRNNELRELKGSKFSIGGMRSGIKTFEEIVIPYQDDDLLYLFTDGYIDQFGGPDNKKFMVKRFREQIIAVNKLPMPDQKKKLDDTITSWIGNNEQTDDILVIGIRF